MPRGQDENVRLKEDRLWRDRIHRNRAMKLNLDGPDGYLHLTLESCPYTEVYDTISPLHWILLVRKSEDGPCLEPHFPIESFLDNAKDRQNALTNTSKVTVCLSPPISVMSARIPTEVAR